MLGLDDPWVALGYILCIASALLCVAWALIAKVRRRDDAD